MWTFLHGRFVSSHLLIYNHLYQYRFKDTYFILGFIIQYYFISLLKWFYLWPLGAPSVPSYIPSIHLHRVEFCFLKHFLWYSQMLQAHLLHFLPQSQNMSFLQRALVPFIREWYWNPKSWFLVYSLLLQGLVSSSLHCLARKSMCVY